MITTIKPGTGREYWTNVFMSTNNDTPKQTPTGVENAAFDHENTWLNKPATTEIDSASSNENDSQENHGLLDHGPSTEKQLCLMGFDKNGEPRTRWLHWSF